MKKKKKAFDSIKKGLKEAIDYTNIKVGGNIYWYKCNNCGEFIAIHHPIDKCYKCNSKNIVLNDMK